MGRVVRDCIELLATRKFCTPLLKISYFQSLRQFSRTYGLACIRSTPPLPKFSELNDQTPFGVSSSILHFLLYKKAYDESHQLFYGVSNGIGLEKYCIEFAKLTIHEIDLIENISKIIKV